MASRLRLGVNVDHVATVRNARGGRDPDPVRAAQAALTGGADGITAHLREDRRHIKDADIERLRRDVPLPLNLEMAASPDMVEIALRVLPHAVCLVPEKRTELTTEGGLDVAGQLDTLAPTIGRLVEAGIRVSLFVDPDPHQVEAALAARAPVIELHTGAYCDAAEAQRPRELARLVAAAARARQVGLECHAGHGLSFATVQPVAAIPELSELNIGHFLIGEALMVGLPQAVARMRRLMDGARDAGLR